MDISYRRTPPSLLERVLARLLKRGQVVSESVRRIDLVHHVDLDFSHAAA